MRTQALADATLQIRKSHVAVVSTISKNMAGYPFGSVTPFMSDSDGKIYLYISDIAQHARNLHENNKTSITVYNQTESGDQNENARITIVGDAKVVDDAHHDDMLDRYVQLFPEAESYKQAHDFKLWQIDVKRVRYIGGFGKIFWLEQEEWNSDPAPWNKQEADGMITHMNDDHQDAMALILQHYCGVNDEQVIMSGIVSDGCYLHSQARNYFIPFAEACIKKSDARKQLVDLTHTSRAALSEQA
jgi:hypothetical protein